MNRLGPGGAGFGKGAVSAAPVGGVDGRRMDDPQDRSAGVNEGDVDGKFPPLADELLGAVQGIDQPERRTRDIGDIAGGNRFFGDDGEVVGDLFPDGLGNEVFGQPVGLGDGRGIRFLVDLEIAVVDFHDFPSGAQRDIAHLVHGLEVDVENHVQSPLFAD